jgi:hypothetical protein
MRRIALAAVLLLALAPTDARAADEEFLPAWEGIRAAEIAEHVRILAGDDYEGREPGTPGEAKTLDYLQKAFGAMGVAGGAPGGGYLQPVPLVELKRTGTPRVTIKGGGRDWKLVPNEQFVPRAGRALERVAFEGRRIVFVGHGITAPEEDWDDYAGADVRGAVVLLLRGEPGGFADTTLFAGRALTRHGVPGAKAENAARHGAVGTIVVHTDSSAGHPWSVLAGGGLGTSQQFLAEAGDSTIELSVHLSEPVVRELCRRAETDFDALRAAAGSRGFRARPLPLTLDASFVATLRRIESHNVVARIDGREARDEAVVYTAHWDHVGRNPSLEGDTIFNGAVDNATGTAGLLELAQAFAALPRPPRRTVVFVATTAEEKGLLGSEYLASHPVVPLERTVGVINLDALFPFGSFDAYTVTGFGSSELEDVLAVAARRLGRTLQDDGAPEAGAYYRSDHYPFAKRGVPALFAVGNPGPATAADDPVHARFAAYMTGGYHKPGDQYDAATWDLRGVEQDVRGLFETGWRLAADTRWPNWRYGNSFRTLRDWPATSAP